MQTYIKEALDIRLQELYDGLCSKHVEYAKLRKECESLCGIIDPILNHSGNLHICQGDIDAIRKYIDHQLALSSIEQDYFYQQGYLDCISLLRLLKVIR